MVYSDTLEITCFIHKQRIFLLLDTIVTIYKMENLNAHQDKEAGVFMNLIKQNPDEELKRSSTENHS